MGIKYKFLKYIITPIKRSIRLKLLILIMMVAMVPLTVAIIISSTSSRDVMVEEILMQNNSKMEWVDNDFNESVNRIDETLTSFFFDTDLMFYINRLNDSAYQSENTTYFNSKLKNYLLANIRDFVSVSFYVFNKNKAFIASYEKNYTVETLTQNEYEINPLFQITNSLFYLPVESESGLISVEGPYMTKLYHRFADQKLIGALVVRLNWNLFESAYELLNTEKENEIFFLNNKGEVIYQGEEKDIDSLYIKNVFDKVKQQTEEGYFLFEDRYVFFQELSNDLYLIKTIPTSIANNVYRKSLTSQLVVIFISGFLIISLSLLIGSRLTKPIKTLTTSMQDINQVLESSELPKSIVKSNDEIKILEQSYLFMIKRIQELIDQEYKQKIETQSAQLMALQAQINPHFMYNTMQMIGAMAIEKGSEDIYNVMMAFSKMMRYNMQLSEELVTIEEELNNVHNYLQIQTMRFERKIEVKMNIEESSKKYLIPKLSIQPIVENCFVHGFKKVKKMWHIEIHIFEKERKIFIEVSDNGEGILKDILEEINDNLSHSTDTFFAHNRNLGLKNIDSRIKLYYGKYYGIQMESKYGMGTKVTIRLAKRTKEI